MDCLFFSEDAPGSNVKHIAEHGLTPEEAESAFGNIETEITSRPPVGLPFLVERSTVRRCHFRRLRPRR